MEYASKGVAGTGLGTGIAGLALGVGNLLGGNGLLGGWNRSAYCDGAVSHYELELEQRNAALESGIALRDANIFTDRKLLEVYKYFDGELKQVREELSQQKAYNAANTVTLNCMQNQLGEMLALTKRVIPNGSVCPGWGDVTVTITPATTATTPTT